MANLGNTLVNGVLRVLGEISATKINGTAIGNSPKFTDTKNTAGTTNKTGAKLFLVGATEQSANPTTYSNSTVYIDKDNDLCSNGKKVAYADDVNATYDFGDIDEGAIVPTDYDFGEL